jgi:HPt (histidine-containing phosphotransfer) domain-containing protein
MSKDETRPVSIDYSIIEELKSLDDEDETGSGLAKLIDLFIQETEKRITLLQQQLPLKDAKRLSEVTHSLKSGSASMGISYMASIAGEMEQLSKANNFSHLEALFEELKLEYGKIKLELLSIKNT